jgi:hypothetical protein
LAVETLAQEIRKIRGLSKEDQDALIMLTGQAVGKVVAAVAGASSTASNAAGATAKLATEYNWLKHEEKDALAKFKYACAQGDRPACDRAAGLEALDKLRNQQLLNACINLTPQACQDQLALDPAAKEYGIDNIGKILVGNVISKLRDRGADALLPLATELAKYEIKPLVDAKGQITGWAVELGSGSDAGQLKNILGAGAYVGTEVLFPTNAVDVLPLAGKGLKVVQRGAERLLVDATGTTIGTLGTKTAAEEAALVSRKGAATAPAKRNSGETVLGHYPDYVELSDSLNARRYQIPDIVWNAMNEEQRWAANLKFLDRTIERRDVVTLATPADAARPGSYYARELNYMTQRGYTVSADGRRLLPSSK